MAEIAKTALLACAFAIKARLLVGRRGVGFVRALGLAEVGLAVASRRRRLAPVVPPAFATGALGTEALHRRPGFQQRSIDRKMLGAQKPLHLRQAEQRRQKLLRHLVGEQAVAVLREGRGVEHPLVDRKPDEPAKQHVELQPFDQLPLRADRIEKLQKRGPQQSLRRDRGTPDPLVKRRKPRVELSQSRVGQPSHRPQRMVRGDPRLDVDVREQRPAR